MSANTDGFLFTFGPDDLSIGEHGLLKLLLCVFKLSSIFLMRLGEVEFGIYIYILGAVLFSLRAAPWIELF